MDPISVGNDPSLKQLRTLVHASAVSILILTGTLFVFFYRQVVSVRKNTAELVNYMAEYERSGAQDFLDEAHRKLAEFSKENADFAPIYKRYFGTNEPPARSAAGTNGAAFKMSPAKVAPAPPR
jgi:hypothetical protein